jgi:hypothetical protein
MGIDISLKEIRELLEALGIYLSDRQIAILLVIVLLISLGILPYLPKVVLWGFKTGRELFARLRRTQEQVDFMRVRNRFANNRLIEIERMNQESDWNDFYYTELEAEVEIESLVTWDKARGNRLLAWLYSIPLLFKQLLYPSSTRMSTGNLIDAISKSPTRAYLVIGDPGSGKTVSLRYLSMRMAMECTASHSEKAAWFKLD